MSPDPRRDTELALPHDATLEQVRDALDALGGTDGDGWVVGVVGPRVLLDDRIQRDVLDAVAPHRPVWLAGYTSHGAVLNSCALRRLELGEGRPAVAGGWSERCDDARHRGVLHEYEAWVASRRRRDGSPDDAIRAYREIDAAAVRWGITSYQQMAGDRPAADALDILREVRPRIRWRVVPMPMSTDDRLVLDDAAPRVDLPGVTVSGRKWILDGTPIEAAAAASERLLLRDLPHTGAGLALGSDGPLNPWLSILAAITTPSRPDQALTRQEAITAYTPWFGVGGVRRGRQGHPRARQAGGPRRPRP